MLLVFPLMIGTTEIVLLAGVALLIFGGKKLPEMMRNMGKGVKEFKEGVQGAPQEFEAGMRDDKDGGKDDESHIKDHQPLQEDASTPERNEQ